MNEQQNNGDLLNIVSILLALQNLQENREQTKQNDVQAANDKQAKLLTDEMNAIFHRQENSLNHIATRLFNMEKKLDKVLSEGDMHG